MEWDYSFLGIDREDGRITGGPIIPATGAMRRRAMNGTPRHTGSRIQYRNWQLRDLSCRCTSKPGINESEGLENDLLFSV